MAEFNLIDEPWIPCVDLEGRLVEYGIKDTLLKAHELREIVDDSPLVTVAIHRLMLAILYRAFEGPTGMKEWRKIYDAGTFQADGPVGTYLDEWHDRFFLFHAKYPFMQVADLDLNEYKPDGSVKKDKSSGMMRLAKEAPDEKGRILFDHRMGSDEAEYESKGIIKMLLSAQNYAGTGVASGGRVETTTISPSACSFAPCVEGLVLWLQGDNLYQTLLLNLVPQEICPSDLPAWEDDQIVANAIRSWTSTSRFSGPCQRFAPLSRFIRAMDRRSVFFTNGLKIAADSNDPMKSYSRSKETDEYRAVKLREERAAWRESHSLFAVGAGMRKSPEAINYASRLRDAGLFANGNVPRANLVGMATDKDKALLWRHERMPVPVALLGDVNLVERLGGLLQNAECAGWLLDQKAKSIARFYRVPSGKEPSKNERDDIEKMAKDLDPRPAYWARLERHFFDLLEGLPNDWDTKASGWKPDNLQTATIMWRENIKREAKSALEESVRQLGTTARATQAAARVRTYFNDDDLKPATHNQGKAKGKGGKKKT